MAANEGFCHASVEFDHRIMGVLFGGRSMRPTPKPVMLTDSEPRQRAWMLANTAQTAGNPDRSDQCAVCERFVEASQLTTIKGVAYCVACATGAPPHRSPR